MPAAALTSRLPARPVDISVDELRAMGCSDEQIVSQAFAERYHDERWLEAETGAGRASLREAQALEKELTTRFRDAWGAYADRAMN